MFVYLALGAFVVVADRAAHVISNRAKRRDQARRSAGYPETPRPSFRQPSA